MPNRPDQSPMLNRRSFLKVSAVGATTVTGTVTVTGCATTRLSSPKNSKFKYLRAKDVEIFTAVIPAVIPAEFNGTREENQAKLDRFLPQLDIFMVHSSQFTQTAFADFLDDLYSAPTRILLTGIWRGWDKATPEQVDDFLISWRDSYFNLLRGGYSQLTQLVSVVWYSQPENWPAANYPGPPKHIPA